MTPPSSGSWPLSTPPPPAPPAPGRRPWHLVDREQLDRADAYQRITDAADAGDPAVLAATRQMWLRHDDVDSEEAPARRLYVLERTDTGVFVAFVDIDQEADDTDDGECANVAPDLLPYNDHSEGAEPPVEVLEMYWL